MKVVVEVGVPEVNGSVPLSGLTGQLSTIGAKRLSGKKANRDRPPDKPKKGTAGDCGKSAGGKKLRVSFGISKYQNPTSRPRLFERRELNIYRGRDRLGDVIVECDGTASAVLASGDKLGDFASLNKARDALLQAAREARP